MLRAKLEEITPAPRPMESDVLHAQIDSKMHQFTEERAALIAAIRNSSDLAALKANGAKLTALNNRIHNRL